MHKFNDAREAITWVLMHAQGDCSFHFYQWGSRKQNHIRGAFIRHPGDGSAGMFMDASEYEQTLVDLAWQQGEVN